MNSRFFRTSVLQVTIVILVLYSIGLSAQENENGTPQSYGRAEFILDFRKGVLLVRLQDRHLSIKSLEERGLDKQAEQIRNQQRRENRETILSFGKTFDFCPVYFFYAKDSEAIRKGDYQNKVFDANFEIVNIESDIPVFTAEFSETEVLGIDGLIVMDHQLLKFEDPLPYFERRYVFFGLIERSKAKMAEAYNEKLYDYLKLYQVNQD